jgi:hypothetical protein
MEPPLPLQGLEAPQLTAEQRERMLRNKQAAQARLESKRKKQRLADTPQSKESSQQSGSYLGKPGADVKTIMSISSRDFEALMASPAAVASRVSEESKPRHMLSPQPVPPPLWVKEGARNVLGLLNGNAMQLPAATGKPAALKLPSTKTNNQSQASAYKNPSHFPTASAIPSTQSQTSDQQHCRASSSGSFLVGELRACSTEHAANKRSPAGIASRSNSEVFPALPGIEVRGNVLNPAGLERSQSTAQQVLLEDSPDFDEDWFQELDSFCKAQRDKAKPLADLPERHNSPVGAGPSGGQAGQAAALLTRPVECFQTAMPRAHAQSAQPRALSAVGVERASVASVAPNQKKATLNQAQAKPDASQQSPDPRLVPLSVAGPSPSAAIAFTSTAFPPKPSTFATSPVTRPPCLSPDLQSQPASAAGPVAGRSIPCQVGGKDAISSEEGLTSSVGRQVSPGLLSPSDGWRTVVRDRPRATQVSDQSGQRTPKQAVALPREESVKSSSRQQTPEQKGLKQGGVNPSQSGVVCSSGGNGQGQVTPKQAMEPLQDTLASDPGVQERNVNRPASGNRRVRQQSIQFSFREPFSPSHSSSKPQTPVRKECANVLSSTEHAPNPSLNPPTNRVREEICHPPSSKQQDQLLDPPQNQPANLVPELGRPSPSASKQVLFLNPSQNPATLAANQRGSPYPSAVPLSSPPQRPVSSPHFLHPQNRVRHNTTEAAAGPSNPQHSPLHTHATPQSSNPENCHHPNQTTAETQSKSPRLEQAQATPPAAPNTVSEEEGLPSYLRKLNPSQKQAVLTEVDRPLLVLAGPGSGKTSTMVARLLHLLSQGVRPPQVRVLTLDLLFLLVALTCACSGEGHMATSAPLLVVVSASVHYSVLEHRVKRLQTFRYPRFPLENSKGDEVG